MVKELPLTIIARADLASIDEGGVSRDAAVVDQLDGYANVVEIDKRKIFDLMKFVIVICSSRYPRLLLFYPFVGWPISNRTFFNRLFLRFFQSVLLRILLKKTIYLDVSDLPCEQSRDVLSEVNNSYDGIEKTLFQGAEHLFLASPKFKEYLIRKYNLDSHTISVVKNAGIPWCIEDSQIAVGRSETLHCVYAGTLNKGRSIEEMIDQLSGLEGVVLFLLGRDGEWLRNKELSPNIRYIGALEEKTAQAIVSICDLGLIPYDSTGKYYNLCYPTKLPFYLASGVPFLSTPIESALELLDNQNIGFVAELCDWRRFLSSCSVGELREKKRSVQIASQTFTWPHELKQMRRYFDN